MSCEPQKPLAQYQWLQQLVGEWSYEHECVMGPDQPPSKATGRESVRSLGGLWTIAEGVGEAPGMGEVRSVTTLGYDPQKQRFVGTFIASMMTFLWVYEGSLDEAGKVLTLEVEGPSMAGDGQMVKYHDIHEFVSPDHRTLTSRMQGPDGKWVQFMQANYRRQK
jgi:hypothetical protein